MTTDDKTDTLAQIPDDDQTNDQAADQVDVQSDDPDDIELQEALEAAKAEEAAAKGEQQDDDQPDAESAKPDAEQASQNQNDPNAAKAAEGEDDKPPGIMIPKQRFDQVNNEKAELSQQNAYLQGQIEAYKAGIGQPQPGQPGAKPAEPTAQDRLIDIHMKQDELSAKFDEGEITFAELTKQNRALSDQESAIREEILVAKVRPTESQPAAAQSDGDLYLDQKTIELEESYPLINVIATDTFKPQFDALVTMARTELEAETGGPLPNSDRGKYALRQRVAEMCQDHGPVYLKRAGWTDEQIAQASGKPVAQPQPSSDPSQPQLSPESKARQAKLELAGEMPPNVASMNGNAGGSEMTDTQIANLDDEEISALPASTRNKLLGIQP